MITARKGHKLLLMLIVVVLLIGCRKKHHLPTTLMHEQYPRKMIKVGFVTVGSESDWRLANTESVVSTFTEEKGFELILIDGQQKYENQIKALRNLIQQQVDYIILSPIIETGWESILQEVKGAGVTVILSGGKVKVSNEDYYIAWVGANYEKEGELIVAWLIDHLKRIKWNSDKINVVEMRGTVGSSEEVGRTKGIGKKLAEYMSINLLDIESANFVQLRAQEVMTKFLRKYPEIDVVITQNDNMAFGAIDAIHAAGKNPGEDILVISIDGVRAALEKIAAGEMNASMESTPLHGPIIEKIIRDMRDGKDIIKNQYTQGIIIDAENVEKRMLQDPY